MMTRMGKKKTAIIDQYTLSAVVRFVKLTQHLHAILLCTAHDQNNPIKAHGTSSANGGIEMRLSRQQIDECDLMHTENGITSTFKWMSVQNEGGCVSTDEGLQQSNFISAQQTVKDESAPKQRGQSVSIDIKKQHTPQHG